MTDTQSEVCRCTAEGYSPECPQTFMQGGKMLHVLSNDMQLRPRQYDGVNEPKVIRDVDKASRDVMQYLDDAMTMANEAAISKGSDTCRRESLATSEYTLAPRKAYPEQSPLADSHPPLADDHDTDFSLQADHRATLDKFEPLKVNGSEFTEAAIGGFRMNLEKVREKIESYVPLPPAVLPKIFLDPNLNFYHHFMQGLEILAGRQYITRIMTQGTYAESDKGKILPALKKLIKCGWTGNDTELTVFVKRVLCSTFDTRASNEGMNDQDALLVAANLWGFPYIESGMTCREADIKMWLHMAYAQYRMVWFNSFKSSGIPAFAMDGVQDRYTGVSEVRDRQPRSQLRIDDHMGKDPNGHRIHRRPRGHGDDRQSQRYADVRAEPAKQSFWSRLT